MRIDDADLLDEVLTETTEYSADLKALVLRMIHQQGGRVEPVAQQTGLPLSTLYHWTRAWNETQRPEKKRISDSSGHRRRKPLSSP